MELRNISMDDLSLYESILCDPSMMSEIGGPLPREGLPEKLRRVVHAFPATTNGPSNSICRKMGFSMIEECDFEYEGRVLRCDHWRLDLRPAGPA